MELAQYWLQQQLEDTLMPLRSRLHHLFRLRYRLLFHYSRGEDKSEACLLRF